MRLGDEIAFVTGGASGIGAATARRLASEGARVVIGDLDEPGAKVVAGELDGLAVALDVVDRESVREAFAAAERECGPVSVLVNSAGTDRFAMFVDTDEDVWDFVLQVNLRGTLACSRAVLPAMYERGRGTVVNVASEAGRIGAYAGATYSAAKAGVIGFTKAIARESARHGVRCNAVSPGPIDTPLLEAAATEYGPRGTRLRDAMVGMTVLQRMGEADEVAAAIAFLASPDASYITGHTLPVSGGLAL
ncbi:MAG TPA: SDR family oxidoreductase [Acidimicrobiia bacterium]|jgi:2-hydroxycyclohexanecarboxyl-CoA dehydrogenase